MIFCKANKHTGNDEYAEIARELCLDKPLYSLRHTFATRCAEMSITPKQTMMWCGHSSIEVTLKYYVNINDAFEQANIEIKNK